VLERYAGAVEPEAKVAACSLPLHADQFEVRLDTDIAVDVDAFDHAAAIALEADDPASYRAALDLYTGDLLPDVDGDEVIVERRRQLRETFLSLLVGLARLYEEKGSPVQARSTPFNGQ